MSFDASGSKEARRRTAEPARMERLARAVGPEFTPAWWLRNRHAQTLWSPLLRRRQELPFELEWLAMPDGDRVALHHLEGASRAGSAAAPRVLLLHGLEGSRRSKYVTGTAARLVERGFSITVLEFRSCSGELNEAPRLYHSGETTDLDFVVGRLVERQPGAPLYLAGVSLGANVLLKWLGERADSLPAEIEGAAAVCTPFDLTVSGPTIDRALFGFYRRFFLRSLRPKGLAKAAQYPSLLDRDRIAASRTFEQYDHWATAALHGFDDAWDYWRKASSGPYLERIRCPCLLVSSRDDPFNPASTLPYAAVERSNWLLARFPERGGHVGFIGGRWPWRAHWWAEQCVERFFVALAEEATT